MPRKPSTKPAAAPVEDEVDDVEVEDTADEVEDTDVEVEDDSTDDDVDDLEVEDAEEEPEPAPKKTAKKKAESAEKPAKVEIQFGSAWLAEYVNEQTGKEYNAFGIRTLLRKLVKDGVIQRDVGEDRSRYNFTAGAKDPVVKAVIKAIKDGSAEKAKNDKIAEAKAAAKAKTEATAEKPAAKKAAAKGAKAAPEPEVAAEDDDLDEDIEDL